MPSFLASEIYILFRGFSNKNDVFSPVKSNTAGCVVELILYMTKPTRATRKIGGNKIRINKMLFDVDKLIHGLPPLPLVNQSACDRHKKCDVCFALYF
jgi:hypothetical protein